MSAPHILSVADVRKLRLRALGLSTSILTGTKANTTGATRAAAVVTSLFAVQGQDWRASHWAVGARLTAATAPKEPPSTHDAPAVSTDVDDALNDGRIVRSWPMRGTLHLVAAEDIGWMQTLTNKRSLASAKKRREYLQMSDNAHQHLVDVSVAALQIAGVQGLSREELTQAWSDAGLSWNSPWRYHLVWWLCQTGIATLGPVVAGAEPRLVSAEQWISAPRSLSGDEALMEFGRRYATPRGPVTAKDLSWWSSLSLTESRTALQFATEAGDLVQAQLDGDASATPMWISPGLLESLETSLPGDNTSLLLAPFDEHLLGYTDRTAQLDARHLTRVDPQRNGSFRGTVVQRGEVVATWKRPSPKAKTLEVSPFPGKRVNQRMLRPSVRAWSAFYGLPEPSVVMTT